MEVDPDSVVAIKIEIEKYAKETSRFYNLAVKLHDLHAASKEEFKKIAESGLISRRRAYQLKKIADVFKPLSCTKKKLEAVGFTRLLAIAESKMLEAGAASVVLDFALNHTTKELKNVIAKKISGEKQHVFTLYLSAADYAIYRKILIAHGAKPHGKGLQHQEAALMQVVKKLATT